jgi:hypothetical protein
MVKYAVFFGPTVACTHISALLKEAMKTHHIYYLVFLNSNVCTY